MNPLKTTQQETFRAGSDDLVHFQNRLIKLENGALLFCQTGEADLIINLESHHIVPNTTIILLPGTVLSRTMATSDFETHFFAFSEEMFHKGCFRLDPAFIRFLKETPCYTHTDPAVLCSVQGLVAASNAISEDRENRFRETIAQNLLQIFFLDVYDKAQRFFTTEQIEGSDRKEQLFKRFISLIHTHCVEQRDVTFYARKLCISTRYLSAITKQMGSESAKELIDNFLMLELKVALQSTDLSLKEIAERYHFPDQSFFGRYFKKHTGMSPKEYRTGRVRS